MISCFYMICVNLGNCLKLIHCVYFITLMYYICLHAHGRAGTVDARQQPWLNDTLSFHYWHIQHTWTLAGQTRPAEWISRPAARRPSGCDARSVRQLSAPRPTVAITTLRTRLRCRYLRPWYTIRQDRTAVTFRVQWQ